MKILTIDLMYGLGENSLWQRDLEKAVSLNIPHISSYNLTIEPQTTLGKWLKKGKIQPVDEELSAQQFEMLIDFLAANGYEQYEISNFAKPNRYARHNSSYWKRHPYLGVGPSAHSFNGTSRQYNVSNNAQYIRAIEKNAIPCVVDQLTPHDQVNDYLLTSLRTVWGCDLEIIQKIAGIDLREVQKSYLTAFVENGWLRIVNNVLFLTPKGKLFADRIASDLFLI